MEIRRCVDILYVLLYCCLCGVINDDDDDDDNDNTSRLTTGAEHGVIDLLWRRLFGLYAQLACVIALLYPDCVLTVRYSAPNLIKDLLVTSRLPPGVESLLTHDFLPLLILSVSNTVWSLIPFPNGSFVRYQCCLPSESRRLRFSPIADTVYMYLQMCVLLVLLSLLSSSSLLWLLLLLLLHCVSKKFPPLNSL